MPQRSLEIQAALTAIQESVNNAKSQAPDAKIDQHVMRGVENYIEDIKAVQTLGRAMLIHAGSAGITFTTVGSWYDFPDANVANTLINSGRAERPPLNIGRFLVGPDQTTWEGKPQPGQGGLLVVSAISDGRLADVCAAAGATRERITGIVPLVDLDPEVGTYINNRFPGAVYSPVFSVPDVISVRAAR